MNIDILENNPSWVFYIAFAIPTFVVVILSVLFWKYLRLFSWCWSPRKKMLKRMRRKREADLEAQRQASSTSVTPEQLYKTLERGCVTAILRLWEIDEEMVYRESIILSEKNDIRALRALIEHGFDVNRKLDESTSRFSKGRLLFDAAALGRADVVKLLLSAGAKRDIVNEHSQNALHMSTMYAYEDTEVTKALLDAGVKVNALSDDGYTPLIHASEAGRVELIQALLDAGADVNLCATSFSKRQLSENTDRSKLFYTPLKAAAEAGHLEAARLLLEKGATVDLPKDSSGKSALTLACLEGGNDSVVKLLLDHGADFEFRDQNSKTPLMLTVESPGIDDDETLDIIVHLLRKGADETAKDKDGKMAIDYARSGGKDQCCRALQHRMNVREKNSTAANNETKQN